MQKAVERDDQYNAIMIDKFEQSPKPIKQFLEEEKVPQEVRPELEKMLRAVLLLQGTARALRKAVKLPMYPHVMRGDNLNVAPGVHGLRVFGGHFVVMDKNSGNSLRVTQIEVEPDVSEADENVPNEPTRLVAY